MSQLQAALLDGFCAWDAPAMTAAARAMIEATLNEPLDADSALELSWSIRELLEAVEGHPGIVGTFRAGDADFLLGVRAEWQEGRPTALGLQLGVAHTARAALRARWVTLGFSQEPVAIPRSKVRVPVPLKGEAGYGRSPSPSIHVWPHAGPPAPSATWAAGRALAHGKGPWLRRYRAGEHEAVWRELHALGAAVRAPDVYGDAVDVALETMSRARIAIEILHQRLLDTGYEFMWPDEGFVPAAAGADDEIAALEQRVGPLPLSLCAFHSLVGSVDFCGEHPAWTSPGEAILDPLVVAPGSWLFKYDEEQWQRHAYHLEFAPDRFHKEDISGGPPYTLIAPDAGIDGVVRHEATGPTFVELLRRSLLFGGFPGWSGVEPERRPIETLGSLTKDLSAL